MYLRTYTSPKRYSFILMKKIITVNIFMANSDQSGLSLHKTKLKPDLCTSERQSHYLNVIFTVLGNGITALILSI